jgi:outer membrane protein
LRKTFIATLLCVISLSAGEYDFDALLAKTLQNSHKLKTQKLSVQISKEELNSMTASEFGEVTFKEDFHRSNHAGMVFGDKLSSREASFRDFGFSDFLRASSAGLDPLPLTPQELNNPKPRNNFDTAVEYQALIFAGFKLDNLKNAAKNKISAEELLLRSDEKSVTLEMLKAYNAAVSANAYIEATKKAKESAVLIYKNTTLAYKQKVVATIELKEAEYHLVKSEGALIEAQKNAKIALAYLAYLSGATDVDFVGELKNIELKSEIVQEREDIKAGEFYVKSATDTLAAQKAAYLPQVVGFAKYGFNDNILSLSPGKDYYVVGAGLSWKLFDMGSTSAKVESARMLKQKSELMLQNGKEYAKFEIARDSLSLESKKKDLEQKAKAAELAEEIRQKYALLRKNGMTQLSELLKKEAESFMANAELINAKTELINAKAQLKIALGQNIFE